ncbi:MAG: AAA family ATPase [Clostridiales bacterium]|jgi:MoxR-like ATPase|nr:AAA family ATPase [Clostridiales bacterium]
MAEIGTTRAITDVVKDEIGKAVINQGYLTTLALAALLGGGHVLIEGVPGLAKTLWVKSLAKTLSVDFKRVQFTSDLMPSDILGAKIFNMKTSEFDLRKGPLFTNLFLADEINRTPPKTQSALLEAMQERAITIDGETMPLSEPFMVLATQNPLEHEGAYPLPEALTDRFMLKLKMTYPGVAAEKAILRAYGGELAVPEPRQVCNAWQVAECRSEVAAVHVDDSVYNYIVSVVETTRRMNVVDIGSSPRGALAILACAKALAAMEGRDYLIPDDVKAIAPAALRHRITLKADAELDGITTDKVVENILAQTKVPR